MALLAVQVRLVRMNMDNRLGPWLGLDLDSFKALFALPFFFVCVCVYIHLFSSKIDKWEFLHLYEPYRYANGVL